MSEIKIGNDDERRIVLLDIDLLLRSRLLIQANSGGGKSWLLRRIAEQLFGKLPVIIIDPEGEFATLRERCDYVLVGKGGDTPADIRSAALLAHRLLELHASAVCDLFEMKPGDRHEWVHRFLTALIDAPKKLWQRCVVIVDEAHLFAPERGHGDSVASDAMTGLVSRGRKRGFGVIMATQRLGKLRKDVAAEMLNVLIGHTFIDVDRERAADALGVTRGQDRETFYKTIKTFQAGQFYALGRALDALDRRCIRVGGIETTHPEPGSSKHAAAPPPSPAKVRALLPKLSDLPAEAEQRDLTVREMKTRLRELERDLAAERKRTAVPATTSKTVEVPALTAKDRKAIEGAAASFEAGAARLDAVAERCLSVASDTLQKAFERLTDVRDDARRLAVGAAEHAIELRKLLTARLAPATRGPVLPAEPRTPPPAPAQRMPTRRAEATAAVSTNGDGTLGRCERAILAALTQHPDGCTAPKLTIVTGYRYSGGFKNALSTLRSAGHLTGSNTEVMRITESGLDAVGEVPELPVGRDLARYWLQHGSLGVCERGILTALLATPSGLTAEKLCETTNYQYSGGFKNALSKLRTIGLLVGKNTEAMRPARELLD